MNNDKAGLREASGAKRIELPSGVTMAVQRKLLFYTHALVGGGAERVWALLASGFARRGHDVILATDWDAPENLSYIDARIRRVQVGRGKIESVRNLAALLRREQPDAALSALAVSNLKLFAATLLAGRSRTMIQSLHGFFQVEPGLLSRAGALGLPVSSRMTGATVAVSQVLRDDLVRRFHAAPDRTLCIHNPIDIDPALPAPTLEALRARPPLVLAMGRLEPQKNYDLLLRAFALVRHPGARLVIVGEGSARPALEALVRDLGLGARVDMPGYAVRPWPWYDEAACLVVSSRSESFGLTLVEAMARGLPVVSTDCMGPREILEDGRFGALVPFGDPVALAAALDAALADPGDPAPRLAQAARFGLERIVDSYDELITRVIAAAR
jgi:glycosyltransferase involved in cell wall biosynthesis